MDITFVGQAAALNANSYLSDGSLRAAAEREHRDPVADAMRRAGADRVSAIKSVAAGQTAGASNGVSSGEASTLQQILHRVRTFVPSSAAIGDGANAAVFTSTGEVGRLIEYLSAVALAIGSGQVGSAEPDPAAAEHLAAVETALAEARALAESDQGARGTDVETIRTRLQATLVSHLSAGQPLLADAAAADAATARTRAQIVSGSAAAVSAQANSAPETVLSLIGAAA